MMHNIETLILATKYYSHFWTLILMLEQHGGDPKTVQSYFVADINVSLLIII